LDLQKLFAMQKELDAHIEKEHPRKNGQSRQSEKVLALLVELGELANETRCFKFWSNKPPSERNIILEEFVDGIHFLLSLGLEMEVKTFEINTIKKESITKQFIVLYNAISLLSIHVTPFIFGKVFSAYLGLGEMLGFTREEIEKAYIEKNKVNHQRQENGY
jgi:dimeric dUTPase (all-alpha-NTP-PPase superfamily)